MALFQTVTVAHQMPAGHFQPAGCEASPSGPEGGSVITGNLILSLSSTGSSFRLWQTGAPGNNDAPVLLSGKTIMNGIGVSWGTAATASFYIEATNSGSATLTYTFVGSGDAEGIRASASLKMTAFSFGLVPDYDRDGVIDATDQLQAATNRVLRWWINDDADNGDIGNGSSDVPGQSGGWFGSANYDGKIDDADEPLEENPGGLVCVCTNNLTKIELTLKPDGLPGKVTLSATAGGQRIRVWQNTNRIDQITLPKTWNAGAQPGALYVEGVAASAAARDVELKLEYDETPLGDNSGLFKCDDRVKLTVVKIDMITPAGDPINSPVDGGDGTGSVPDGANEFTFSSATPGVLTLQLKARVTPSGVATQVAKRAHYTVDEIGASDKVWDAANPDGKPTASGDHLLATVTFTGLPEKNSDFGKKKAAVYFDGSKQDEESYEVFFSRDATNSPGGPDPNWFYYWGQVYVNKNVKYVAAAKTGRTPAMTGWNYANAADKTRIEIGSGHPAKYKSYGIGKEASGIDRYIMTVIHEEKHVAQIAAADALLPTSGADSFRFGWSWNQPAHNHWRKGPDGQWGVAGVDDDGNGMVDDAAVAPPFEPGKGDDISLDHVTWPWWPTTWVLPSGVYVTIHPIEGEAVKAADDAMEEHDYAPQDWGDPGKNHKTIKKWDD